MCTSPKVSRPWPRVTILSAISLALLTMAGRGAAAQTEATAPAEAAEAATVAPEAAKPVAEAVAPAPAPAKCECAPCPPPAPPVPPPASPDQAEWKAQAKGGLAVTGGNAQSKNFSFGLNASRKRGDNKLALEGGLAYGTTNNLVAHEDPNVPGVIGSLDRQQVTSTNNWTGKGRYDRFFTENNTGYTSGQAAADKIAGKTFYGGAQAGYSRQLRKDAMNIVVAELGYDFSYERYVQRPGKTLDPVEIHSARIMLGETLTLTPQTGITASVECLLNLNKEGKAINSKDGTAGVDALKDTRVNGKVALTTNLYKQLSFGFGFALKYDQNPAPRPVPSAASGLSFPAMNVSWAYADKVDTLTEATLIYTFF